MSTVQGRLRIAVQKSGRLAERSLDLVRDAGLRVVPIPGASATLAALVASGLAAHPFTVLGFPCNQFMFQEPGSNARIEPPATSPAQAEAPAAVDKKTDTTGA
jgi:hypothetical protein